MADRIKFRLDGCDISFIADAPEDITLKQLLKQTDRIVPDYCACGIRSARGLDLEQPIEISIDYDDIKKIRENAPCRIKEAG